jgi:uncharacterized protein (DUF362 family)/Pyruvate/2-oxoacid:ferredoxin oxidoreductase delta subunit
MEILSPSPCLCASKAVAFGFCENYDREKVYQVIERLLLEIPPPSVYNKIVLLKPNIVVPKKPERAACTHPAVVYAMIKALSKRGAAKIIVGDSSINLDSKLAARVAGIYDAVVEAGAEWIDFDQMIELPCVGGKIVKSVFVAESVKLADVIITLPKLKTHALMAYTGAMKNMFGLVVGNNKSQTHYRFPDKNDFSAYLTDLNIALKPQYGLMDGVLAMSGNNGPTNGMPAHVGILATSCNVLALDWMCASLIGYNPHQIANLDDALNRRIWLNSPDEIELKGDDFAKLKPVEFNLATHVRQSSIFEEFKPTNFKRILRLCAGIIKRLCPWLHKILRFLFSKYPHFIKEKCIFCKNCIEICPAKALFIVRKKRILLNRSKCIHCFCCHEICPNGAIKLQHSFL